MEQRPGIFLHLIGHYGNFDMVKVARINHCHQSGTLVVLLYASCDISLRFRRRQRVGMGARAGPETQVMDPQGAGLVFRKYARVPLLLGFGSLDCGHTLYFFFFFEKVKCEEKNALCKKKKNKTPQTE